jgi:hypothetical protein
LFGSELGLAVERNRPHEAAFVQKLVAGAVNGASAGENETLDAHALGELGNHPRRRQVDIDRQRFVKAARRVAHDGPQVDDGVHVLHRLHDDLDMTKVAFDDFEVRVVLDGGNGLSSKNHHVQQPDPVSPGQQLAEQGGADVTRASDDQNMPMGSALGLEDRLPLGADDLLKDARPYPRRDDHRRAKEPGHDQHGAIQRQTTG